MKRILPAAVVIIALVVLAVVLLTYERDLLWKVQEMNLFLYTGLFFKEMMVTSAGLEPISRSISTILGWGYYCCAEAGVCWHG